MRASGLWLAFSLLVAAGCSTTRPAPKSGLLALESAEALEIARLEDARLLGEGKLEAFTRAAAPALRVRALLALARIQAPETTGIVAAALDDAEPAVREMAAFALGQMGLAWAPIAETTRALAEKRLIERLQAEQDRKVRDAIVEALGKVGGADCLVPLVKAGGPRAAFALAVLAKASGGKLKDSLALRLFEELLRSKDESDRLAGAYGFMRYQDPGGRTVLAGCVADSSFAVRAFCGRALGSLGQPGDVGKIAPHLEDPDERVASEIARTLAKLLDACGDQDECPALAALASSKSPWRWAVAAAVSMEPVSNPKALPLFAAQYEALGRAVEAAPDTLAKVTFARTQCEVALSHDRIVGRIDRLTACGKDLVEEEDRFVKSARALSESKVKGEDGLKQMLVLSKLPYARARAAAVAGLAEAGTEEARKRVVDLLSDTDWLVASEAAGAVESAKLEEAGPALVALLERAKGERASDAAQAALSAAGALRLQVVLPAAQRLVTEGTPHVRQAAARAVAALTGTMPKATPPPWEPGAYAQEPLRDPMFVKLTTERGPIRIQLDVREAPMTARSFVGLVKQGFFKGLVFHRVVPDFVAQGGDPTGTGSGGPGYTIRCEMNRLRYQTGSVGMALSGKDTGGSQFFVTVAPHPHLDGRYTIFGQVVEGMEAVRALTEGDRILDAVVELSETPGNVSTLKQ
ncbi:MAG: peptidylprolyl isomerase [Myxococcales bacterium]